MTPLYPWSEWYVTALRGCLEREEKRLASFGGKWTAHSVCTLRNMLGRHA